MVKVGFLCTPEPTQIHKEQSILQMFTCVTGEQTCCLVILFLLNII